MASLCKGVDDYCRLCALESQSGIFIYSGEGEKMCLEEKIINCLRIEVSKDDMLPKRVCQSCNVLLEDYYRFCERARQVQQTLYYLLGLHRQHSQDQETELYLLEGDVKVESNIKKELDDFNIHHVSVQSEVEMLGVKDEIMQKQYCDVRRGRRVEDVKLGDEYCVMSEVEDISEEVKQTHRRKMLMPKKNIQGEEISEEYSQEKDIDHFYRCEEIDQGNIFQDFIEDEQEEEGESSEDEEEEEEDKRKMCLEWNKTWGISCNECEKIFHNKIAFDKHYRFSHNKRPAYTCSLCKKTIEKNSLFRIHILQHIEEGRIRCRFCSKKFFSKEMLKIHSEFAHSQSKIFTCNSCGLGFSSQRRMEAHQMTHKKGEKKELACTECGKILLTRGGLAAHKSAHKLGRHFMCDICGKTFTQKVNMQHHVKLHKGERPHSCDICEKSFAEKSHLNRHKRFHTNDRPFQCSVCKKMYKTERCLKVHSQTHWNSRPFVCSVCGKGFLSSAKLKQHHNCHTGERPFACKYCERTFTNYPNWLKHTRRKHQVDHKTGLSLKKEAPMHQTILVVNPPPQSVIEFIKMPEVEVKEDGRNSVQSALTLVSPSVLSGSQFEIVEDGECQYEMNSAPD